MGKPIVYIASPYTKGDVGINVRFQMEVWNELMDHGRCWPVAPLWSHFQHIHRPRQYQDWIDYDLALIERYDACLRLTAVDHGMGYRQDESSGADGEVAAFEAAGKPVFRTFTALYDWLERTGSEPC